MMSVEFLAHRPVPALLPRPVLGALLLGSVFFVSVTSEEDSTQAAAVLPAAEHVRELVGKSPLEECAAACPKLATNIALVEQLGGSMGKLDSDSYSEACVLVTCITEEAGCKKYATGSRAALQSAACLCGCEHRKTMSFCQKSVQDAETPLTFSERSEKCTEHEECQKNLQDWWDCLGSQEDCAVVRESMQLGYEECLAESKGEETDREKTGGSAVSKRKVVDPRDDTNGAPPSKHQQLSMLLFLFGAAVTVQVLLQKD